MPLDATRMVTNGHLIHEDILQFVDLFTGVMVDQPVTIANDLTAQQDLMVGRNLYAASWAEFDAEVIVEGALRLSGDPAILFPGNGDIGTSTGNKPYNVYASGAFIGNGAVPPGGAAGQVLAKSAAGNYAVGWIDPPSGGANIAPWYVDATTKAFLVSPDNTYDIGQANTNRPRDVFLQRNLAVGNFVCVYNLAFGNTPTNWERFDIVWNTNEIYLEDDFTGTGTGSPIHIGTVSANPVSLMTNNLQRWQVDPNGHFLAATDNAYDIGAFGSGRPRNINVGSYVILPSGTASAPPLYFGGAPLTGIYSSGLNEVAISSVGNMVAKFAASAVTINQPISMSGDGNGSYAINIFGSFKNYGISVHPTLTTTSGVMGIQSQISVAAGVTTADGVYSWLYLLSTGVALTNASLLHAAPSVLGTNTVATMRGVYVENMGASSVTNAYGVYIAAQSGAATTNVGLYNAGLTRLDNHLDWNTDNTYDIGANAARRPRDLWLARSAVVYGQLSVGSSGTLLGTGLYVAYTGTGAQQGGANISPTFSNASTTSGTVLSLQSNFGGGSWVLPNLWTLKINAPVFPPATVTTAYGIQVLNQGAANITNAYGIYIVAQSGSPTTNVGLYNAGTTTLVGAVTAQAGVNVTGGAYTGNGSVPAGGAAGQMLSKVDATNYNLAWATPGGGGLTLPLSQDLTFSANNAYDIGSATNAPRDIYIAHQLITPAFFSATGQDLVFGAAAFIRWRITQGGDLCSDWDGHYNIGSSSSGRPDQIFIANLATIGQRVGIGAAGTSASIALNVYASSLTGSQQAGVTVNCYTTSAATSTGKAMDIRLGTATATYTMGAGYGLFVQPPSMQAGASITTINGIYVGTQGATGITNAYGVYIDVQSGAATRNIGLYNAGTTLLLGNLHMSAVNPPLSFIGIYYNLSLTSNNAQTGIFSAPQFTSTATNTASCLTVAGATQATAWTCPKYYGIWVSTPSAGSGSTITESYGIYISSQGGTGISYTYGILIAPQVSGANANTGLYIQTPSGAVPLCINTQAGATLTTAGAWTNAPSWAASKSKIRAVDDSQLGTWFDWLTDQHAPIRYRHPLVRDDEGQVVGGFTADGDYDHFGFLLDDIPQDIFEVWCANETGTLSTKDTEGFLLAMLKVSGQRIKSLETRLAALEVA